MDGASPAGPAGTDDEAEPSSDSDCCPTVSHGLTDSDVRLDAESFSALAKETRYEALRLLGTVGETCGCQVAWRLDENQSTTSRALGILENAGLIDRRKDGRSRYYATTHRGEAFLTAIDTTRDD